MSIQLPEACHNQHASRGPAGPLAVCLGVGLCAKSYKIVEKLV